MTSIKAIIQTPPKQSANAVDMHSPQQQYSPYSQEASVTPRHLSPTEGCSSGHS